MDKKTKFGNWGAKELKLGENIFKKLKNLFAGIGVAFTSAIFVLGFAVLLIWGFYFLRQLIESRIAADVSVSLDLTKQTESQAPSAGQTGVPGQSAAIESPTSTNVSQSPSDGLVYAGYTDLFSGIGGLNGPETTMYRDNVATAFLFPPSLEWSEKSGNVSAPDFSSACVGGSCLSAKGKVLTLNGSPIVLPVSGDIDNVTADVIGNGWAVGIVLKESGGYSGYAYKFDGSSFAPIFSGGKAFNSQYEGKWGFGGTAGDFLAVYGAYQGKGYRVTESSVSDISQLFDVRVMKGGIWPGIAKAGSGTHSSWYLFNKDRNNRAVFMKLFQNGTAGIAGEADLLGTEPLALSYLAITNASGSFPFSLSVYGEWVGTSHVWNVADNGFRIPSGSVTVTSADLNNYVNTEVPYLIGLTSREFSAGGASISFDVKNEENGRWEAVSLGADHWFLNSHGTVLEWRMRVLPGSNPEYTPYLGQLLVEYKVKRL